MDDFFAGCFSMVFFLFPVGIIVLVFVFAAFQKSAHKKAWEEFARKFGLALKPGGWFQNPSVSGTYKNLNVYLYTYTQGSGKSKTTYTSMVVYLPITNRSHLRISPEGLLSKITKAFGAQDIPIGDPAFDAAFIIKSDTPELVPHILTPAIRGTMLRGRGGNVNVTVSAGTVSFTRVGIERDQNTLHYLIELLVMVGQRVVEIEQPRYVPPQQPAPESLHLPPVTICENCGAEMKWEADRTSGTASCEFCGRQLHFKFANVGLRKR
jgi:hypothetical protein